jgi:hypothetical protein
MDDKAREQWNQECDRVQISQRIAEMLGLTSHVQIDQANRDLGVLSVATITSASLTMVEMWPSSGHHLQIA